jgi:hypothetical protein
MRRHRTRSAAEKNAARIARLLALADKRAGGYVATPERLAELGGSNMQTAGLPSVKGPRDV